MDVRFLLASYVCTKKSVIDSYSLVNVILLLKIWTKQYVIKVTLDAIGSQVI